MRSTLLLPSRSQVSYDDRRRDAHIGADLGRALTCAEALWAQLAQPLADRERWIENQSTPGAIASSLARDLGYLIEHTIYHLAIIKIGLNQGYPHLILTLNLIVAPSTLLYRDKMLAQSQGVIGPNYPQARKAAQTWRRLAGRIPRCRWAKLISASSRKCWATSR